MASIASDIRSKLLSDLVTPLEINNTEKTVVTAHGCGGYHNLNRKIGIKPYEKFDFVKLQDVLNDIESELGISSGTLTCSIYRWTTPGCSLVTEPTMDEQMRDLFFQNYWQVLYNHHIHRKRGLRDKGGDQFHIRIAAGMDQNRPLFSS